MASSSSPLLSSPFASVEDFRATKSVTDAKGLMDGITLTTPMESRKKKEEDARKNNLKSTITPVILPWVGYGTYRLGQSNVYRATLDALRVGYRCIDTAFIYGGQKTEPEVGRAIQTALEEGTLRNRQELFVTSKHWRSYHGYEQTHDCLRQSLKRLQLDYVDLYLMHWPGPAYTSPYIKKTDEQRESEKKDPWARTLLSKDETVQKRGETWRAMEDAYRRGQCRAIGISNFTIRHLEALKNTATLWPPAINQVECHPLYPQHKLRSYCEKEGIILQAYASLGGQDATRAQWDVFQLEPSSKEESDDVSKKTRKKKKSPTTLLDSNVVADIAKELDVSAAQILLRWALQHNFCTIPKTVSEERMKVNAQVFHFSLDEEHMNALDNLASYRPGEDAGRLCWRTDPLRLLDFD